VADEDKLDLSPKTAGTRTEDSLLAERVARELDPDRYAWVAGLGWLHNTGAVWEEASNEALVEAVRLLLKAIVIEEVGAGATPRQLGDLARLLGSGKIRAVAGLVRGILECRADEFDTAKDRLNTPTGIVDLRTGDLLPHGPEFRFTKVTSAKYRPGAHSKDWMAALEAVPADVREYLQIRLGQALIGYPSADDKLLVLQGGGENGKSTLLDAVRAALGSFAGIVPDRVLTASPGDHPTELTMFRGLRLAILEELPEGARFSIKRLKDSVGSTTMTARKIAKDNITWETTHSLFVTSNYYPRISETDNGTWRRLELLRFPYTFRAPELSSGRRTIDAATRNSVPGCVALRTRRCSPGWSKEPAAGTKPIATCRRRQSAFNGIPWHGASRPTSSLPS
jgi:putative DNA primase/helicase